MYEYPSVLKPFQADSMAASTLPQTVFCQYHHVDLSEFCRAGHHFVSTAWIHQFCTRLHNGLEQWSVTTWVL